MNKAHYYAYKAPGANDLDTMYLLPISKDALYPEGRYFVQSNYLVLLSEKSREAFDLIEKFNDDGEYDLNKRTGRPKKERLRVQNNFNYQLTGEDLEWFVNEFVINAGEFLALVEKYKTTKLITAPTVEEVQKVANEQPLIITAE